MVKLLKFVSDINNLTTVSPLGLMHVQHCDSVLKIVLSGKATKPKQ